MAVTIRTALEADHRRIETLLARSTADPDRFDVASYEAARTALLRHIGIEEKIVLPALRARRGEVIRPLADRLRIEHGAIGALLVPTPDAALVKELQALLEAHDRLEEGDTGLYAQADEALEDQISDIVGRIAAAPTPPVAGHFDGHGTHRTRESALRMMEERRAKR